MTTQDKIKLVLSHLQHSPYANVSALCRQEGTSRGTFYDYVTRYPHLAKAWDEIRQLRGENVQEKRAGSYLSSLCNDRISSDAQMDIPICGWPLQWNKNRVG